MAAEVRIQAAWPPNVIALPVFPYGTAVASQAEDLPICWICLDGPSIDRPLMHPCRCPSFVHSSCIARWQLQSAGTRWVLLLSLPGHVLKSSEHDLAVDVTACRLCMLLGPGHGIVSWNSRHEYSSASQPQTLSAAACACIVVPWYQIISKIS